MDPVQAGLWLMLLVIPFLGIVAVVRGKQAFAKDRAETQLFASANGLAGSLSDPISVGGAVDGMPCFVSMDRVGEGKGQRWFLRIRFVVSDGGTYRHAGGDEAVALLVARSENVPFERVSGLHEVGFGDARFDAFYRAFVTPGSVAPWQNPVIRAAIVSFGDAIVRVERGPAECSITLGRFVWRAAFLRRAVVLASSLTSPDAATRHAGELVAPFDASRPVEDTRLGWGIARVMAVTIGAFLFCFPATLVPPIRDLTEYVACDGRETMMTVYNGRGSSEVCGDGVHPQHSVNGWVFFVGYDAGLVVALFLCGIVELAVRSRRR